MGTDGRRLDTPWRLLAPPSSRSCVASDDAAIRVVLLKQIATVTAGLVWSPHIDPADPALGTRIARVTMRRVR